MKYVASESLQKELIQYHIIIHYHIQFLHLVFRWSTHLYMSLFLSICLSLCHTSYLRSHTSSDHNFWFTCVKLSYLQAFLLLFSSIFIFCSVSWVKVQKSSPKWKIKITSVLCHISRTILAYDHDFWYTCVKWWYLQAFFSVFKYFYFLGC